MRKKVNSRKRFIHDLKNVVWRTHVAIQGDILHSYDQLIWFPSSLILSGTIFLKISQHSEHVVVHLRTFLKHNFFCRWLSAYILANTHMAPTYPLLQQELITLPDKYSLHQMMLYQQSQSECISVPGNCN